jgi:hypothetical protein
MLRVEERKGLEIRGPQGKLNRLAGVGDLANRHDQLTALQHPLMHDEPVNLSRVLVQDYIANRSDGLALRVNHSGAKRNEHLCPPPMP